jgi:hypothetical protein
VVVTARMSVLIVGDGAHLRSSYVLMVNALPLMVGNKGFTCGPP